MPVSTPTPEPLPELAPVSTRTATPDPSPTYLTEEIPACTPVPGSSVDPCEPGGKGTLITEPGNLLIFEPTLLVEDLLNSFPTTPLFATHIALRGAYLPGTVRCTSGHQLRGPSYLGRGQASFGLLIYCFADVRVNAYLLGTGPSTLTVIVERTLYTYRGINDDDDYGLEQLEGRRLAYERALAAGGRFEYDGPPRRGSPRSRLVVSGPPGGIGGREVVLFIRPSARTSVEAWEVSRTWDVERREDGTVVALHPNREWFTTPFEQSYAEMELPALTQAVTAAHQARVAANGGRIGEDESLPVLVTDANRLRQYFSDPKVGGYAPGVPTPAQPPPAYAPAPTVLTVGAAGETSLPLSWTSVWGASKYRVEYRAGADGEWTTASDSVTGTNYMVEGLSSGVEYEFRVSAYGDGTVYQATSGLASAVLVVPTQTGTPGPSPTYIIEEIPPCTPAPGSSVDPCEPGAQGTLITEPGSLSIMAPPLFVEDLVSFPVSVHTTHIALRGTYLPGTVRCTSGYRIRDPSYVGGQPGELIIYCFADVRVNAYILGTGPSTLTVIVERSLYTRRGIDDDDDYGLEQLEGRRLAYERALAEGGRFEYDGPPRRGSPRSKLVVTGPPGGIGGREVVLFIGPSYDLSIEAWEIFWTWDVERREDGTAVALHPNRQWFTTPLEQSYAEMELPALMQAVTAAHLRRVAANGGRIGEDESLPMLVSDANRLRQYFSDPKVGGYAPGVPTPAQPPLPYAPAPTGLMAGAAGETSVPLSWTAVPNTSKYRVEYRAGSDGEWTTASDSVTGTN